MVIIPYQARHRDKAIAIGSELKAAYEDRLEVHLLPNEQIGQDPRAISWDDLVVLPFSEEALAPNIVSWLTGLLEEGIPILPLAMSPENNVPPPPVEGIKALPFTEWNSMARMVNRVGAMSALKLRNREHRIFISYRVKDGKSLANQLYRFLEDQGYQVWLDEAKDDGDGETTIVPGTKVQKDIEIALNNATMVLLLDTPEASQSNWIKLEVDHANGSLIPVLPILFRRPGETRRTSRFRSLEGLQRVCDFASDGTTPLQGLSVGQLQQVLSEMEAYLSDVFRRKLRIPFLVREAFSSNEYSWKERSKYIYESLNKSGLRRRVFSHCSHFEGIFVPALEALVKHFNDYKPPANYSLYIYDGSDIPQSQLAEIAKETGLEDNTTVIVLHYLKVPTLLKNHFTNI